MFVEIQVAEGRRVRHPVTRRILAVEEWHRVRWTPRVARKVTAGDVVKRDVAPAADDRETRS